MKQLNQELKNLGKQIAHIRKSNKLSQEELAARSGKMINTISNIERGLADPKISTLWAIAETLHIDITELLSTQYQTDKNSLYIQQINRLLQSEDEFFHSAALQQLQILSKVKQTAK